MTRRNGNIIIVIICLLTGTWGLNAVPEPIHDAVIMGDSAKVKELLETDPAMVNVKWALLGMTPLHCAAEAGHKEIAEALLAKGANVDACDELDRKPLHWASTRDVAEVLLAKGANIGRQDLYGETALHTAAVKGNTEVVSFLIAKGADVNKRQNNAEPPLHYAAIGGHKEIVKLLIAAGADVNTKDHRGETPMQKALKTDLEGYLPFRSGASDSKGAAEMLRQHMGTNNLQVIKQE